MALIGLVNLAERLFNQTQGNPNEDTSLTSKAPKGNASQATQVKLSDEFRPSSGNAANEAGLFHVSQASVFTAAATVLLVQGENTAPAANKTTSAPATTANPATSGTTNTPASPAPTAAASGVTTGAAEIQAELQNLNTALISLGLSSDEIAAVDRVAQLIKDFSPAAFTSLVNQLNVLAQDAAQPTATATTSTAATTGAITGGAIAGTQTGGFSIQALSINFAGIDETLQRGGNTLQISAFQLQVSEVNLTLTNATTGQTAQITAPQAAVTTPATAAPLAKSATA